MSVDANPDRQSHQGRAVLFVPGDRPDRFSKAADSGADAIILDLEDAVPPMRKSEAREYVRQWRADGGVGIVRINGIGSPWIESDLHAILDGGPCGVMVPKAEPSPELAGLADRLSSGSWLLPIIESARGVFEARAVCSMPGVVQLAFGNGDLSAELGIDHHDWDALAWARSTVVFASAEGGIAAPLDGVTTAISDEHALIRDSRRAKSFGFAGKLCIHPSQVPIVRSTFSPTPEAIAWAAKVLASASDGAATEVDGEMVDKALVDRARRLLELHRD